MVDISVSDSLHVVWMTVCLCCLWYWARHVSVFNFNIYLRWLIVGCVVCNLQLHTEKNKCRIITRISKAYATKCTLRWRFASAICWCKIYDFFPFSVVVVFLACDHANNTKKTWNPLNFCTNDLLLMIYLLQLLHCLCTPVFFCSYPLKA